MKTISKRLPIILLAGIILGLTSCEQSSQVNLSESFKYIKSISEKTKKPIDLKAIDLRIWQLGDLKYKIHSFASPPHEGFAFFFNI